MQRKDCFHEDFAQIKSINICLQRPSRGDANASLALFLSDVVRIHLDRFDPLHTLSLRGYKRQFRILVHHKAVRDGYQYNSQAAYLSLLMIASSYRNHGIGNAVVDAIEDEIKKDALATVIFSGVQINNPEAMRFWQRKGYRVISEPKLYPDQTIAVDLQKYLPLGSTSQSIVIG
jgi:ribosomal protein S18 acetylase RimI-like enzyme